MSHKSFSENRFCFNTRYLSSFRVFITKSSEFSQIIKSKILCIFLFKMMASRKRKACCNNGSLFLMFMTFFLYHLSSSSLASLETGNLLKFQCFNINAGITENSLLMQSLHTNFKKYVHQNTPQGIPRQIGNCLKQN